MKRRTFFSRVAQSILATTAFVYCPKLVSDALFESSFAQALDQEMKWMRQRFVDEMAGQLWRKLCLTHPKYPPLTIACHQKIV